MILFRKGVGHDPRAEAFVLCPAGATELSPGFQPWESFTRERRALKGRQIERPNKGGSGVRWSNCRMSQLRALTFTRQ